MAQLNSADSHSMDELLAEMRQHLSGLQDKMQVVNAATNRSQTVNEKIATMKEYQDRVNTLNSCWRSKDRANLVASLQHENRQILALEEENKLLKLALKELEEGMHLIMSDYRRTLSGLTRSELLLDLARRQHKSDFANGCPDVERIVEVSRLAERCMTAADEKIVEQDGVIAQLRCENRTLRELVFARRPPAIKPRTPEGVNGASTDSSPSVAERKDSAIFVKEKSPMGVGGGDTGERVNDDSNKPQGSCREEDFDEKTLVEGLQEVRIELDNGSVVSPSPVSSSIQATMNNAGSRWPVHVKNRHRPKPTYPGASSNGANNDMRSFKGPITLKIDSADPPAAPSEEASSTEEDNEGEGPRKEPWPNGDICDKGEKDPASLNNDSSALLSSASPPPLEGRKPSSPQTPLQQQEQACSN